MKETLEGDEKDDEQLPCLPQEVILENILTRLPVKTLIIFGSVCKLWYNSIHHDPHFASSHFLHSQNNPCLMFFILNVKDNYRENSFLDSYFFISEEKKDDSKLEIHSFLQTNSSMEEKLVGYCNGLVCILRSISRQPVIDIMHPRRHEKLFIFHPTIEGDILYFGFGFDSLSNVYKVVIIFVEYEEFKCRVFTSGTNSWREITCPPSTNHMLKTMRSNHYELSATFCDGALFWTTIRQPRQAKHMLLSFDLHDETFQVIQVPTEWFSTSTRGTKVLNLIELNGSLCLAGLEKLFPTDENNYSISCKVHFHILKDRVNQVWIKEQTTFDLIFSDLSFPCLYNFNMKSFSGRVLLYWFNGKYIRFYVSHMKHLNVIDLSLDFGGRRLSQAQFCEMDYQLNIHMENLISLQTFLPEGDHRNVDDGLAVYAWQDMLNHGAGLVYARKNSSRLYCKF